MKFKFSLVVASLLLFTCCQPKSATPSPSSPHTPEEPPVPPLVQALGGADFPQLGGHQETVLVQWRLQEAYRNPGEAVPQDTLVAASPEDNRVVLASVRDGTWQLGFLSHPTQQELEELAALDHLEVVHIANDALVFVTNTDNPRDDLTSQEIEALFLQGEIPTAADGTPLLLPLLDTNPGNTPLYLRSRSNYLCHRFLLTDGMRTFSEQIQRSDQAFSDSINTALPYVYPTNYGYAGTFRYAWQPDAAIKLLMVDGIAPSFAAIGSGDYPYGVQTYAVYKKDHPGAAAIAQWLMTQEGQDLLAQCGVGVLAGDYENASFSS